MYLPAQRFSLWSRKKERKTTWFCFACLLAVVCPCLLLLFAFFLRLIVCACLLSAWLLTVVCSCLLWFVFACLFVAWLLACLLAPGSGLAFVFSISPDLFSSLLGDLVLRNVCFIAVRQGESVVAKNKSEAHSFPPSSVDQRSAELILSPKKVVGCRGGSRHGKGDSLT